MINQEKVVFKSPKHNNTTLSWSDNRGLFLIRGKSGLQQGKVPDNIRGA